MDKLRTLWWALRNLLALWPQAYLMAQREELIHGKENWSVRDAPYPRAAQFRARGWAFCCDLCGSLDRRHCAYGGRAGGERCHLGDMQYDDKPAGLTREGQQP